MRNIKYILPLFLVFLYGCRASSDYSQVVEEIQENLDLGNLSAAIQETDSLRKLKAVDKDALHIADSLEQIAERVRIDFSVSEADADKQLEKTIGIFSADQKSQWEKKGWLEFKIIDGQKKYFKRAVSNLFLIRQFRESGADNPSDTAMTTSMATRIKHTKEAVEKSDNKGNVVVPVNMKMTYTLTVNADATPDGEIIRCWLPFPRTDQVRQQETKLLSTSNRTYSIAPDTAIHSSIYMEETARKGTPTVFQISFSYKAYAQFFDLSGLHVRPYDKNSSDYKKYTSEQLPHICFTDDIKHLADSIAGNETDPTAIVSKIYLWFKKNIPWTGALEYSIIPNIPDYVMKNRRGDCGMQTFLFLSMLRYKGVPARWQSGWMVAPYDQNLHDWSEVYYEGIGWVPVDVTFDLQNSENPLIRYYFLSGIDAYRLIINKGVEGPLHPSKRYLRSEPYDFQRGEVEWKGGNLYFDKWDYDMKTEYLK